MELVHLAILALTAVAIIMADHMGWQYMSGKQALLDTKRTKLLHRLVSFGLAGMILSGATLLILDEFEVLEEPAFYLKMLFVATLIINGFFIGRLSRIATLKPFASLTSGERMPLYISGAVSTVCWLGAATIGLFFL